MPNQKSNMADFKLEVIRFAKDKGNEAAGRKFSIGETSVREWRKEENELEEMIP